MLSDLQALSILLLKCYCFAQLEQEIANKHAETNKKDTVWMKCKSFSEKKNQGPVVQGVVSLRSSLRVFLLTVLANSIYNILIFYAEKMWVAFALQKLLTFFQQKISAHLRITRCKF